MDGDSEVGYPAWVCALVVLVGCHVEGAKRLTKSPLAPLWQRAEHYAWATIYTNLHLGVSKRIKTYQPWPLGPYPTALWTITLAE